MIWDQFVEVRPDWTPPGPDWPSWEAVYGNELEAGKRTSRTLFGGFAHVLAEMHHVDVLRKCAEVFRIPAVPDPTLWGGGLQVTAPGGFLGCHLDGVVHPRVEGMRRSVTMLCFCHPRWEAGWGGDFFLADQEGRPVLSVGAVPGRLVAFLSGDDRAVHGVAPVSGPCERVTVTTSLLSPLRPGDVRTRAWFLPNRGKK